jgi:hypothetical protein
LTEQIGLAPCEQKLARGKEGPDLFFDVRANPDRMVRHALHIV